jgi:hypothetical protein
LHGRAPYGDAGGRRRFARWRAEAAAAVVIEARIRAGLTQAELAERIGTRLRIVLEPVTR